MSFRHPVNKKEFAREVFIGVSLVVCLFAIFLFVALQKSTGKSLSPLAYLWPDSYSAEDEPIPVVVFRNEQDRLEAMRELQEQYPYQEIVNAPEQIGESQPANPPGNTALANDKHVKNRDNQVAQVQFQQPAGPADKPANKDNRSQQSSNYPVVQADFSKSNSNPPDGSKLRPDKDASGFSTGKSKPEDKQSRFNPGFDIKKSSNNSRPSSRPFELNRNPATLKTENEKSKRMEEFQPAIPQRQGKSFPDSTSGTKSNKNTDAVKAAAIKNSLRIVPESDDSFWKISSRYYGDGKYFRHLAEFNGRSENADQLPNPVLVPPLKELLRSVASKPVKAKQSKSVSGFNNSDSPQPSASVYRTSQDDTTFEIARKELGSASRYVEIIRLNRDRLPENCDAQTRLPGGISLRLPD